MFSQNSFQENSSRVLLLFAVIVACMGFVMIVTGYPAPSWLPKFLGVKSLRKIFQLFFFLSAIGILAHPKRAEWLERLFSFLRAANQGWKGIATLILVYSLLFFWNQLTSYGSAQINFLPFSFYDYMLHYFWLGKINYTHLLHGFYHVNNILYTFAPLWLAVKSPLLLVVLHGPLLALAALPLFLLTRRLFPESWIPLVVSFLYLNCRYLLNLLEMDFLVESFYPLLIFTNCYFLVAGRRIAFWLSLLFVLLVKEDAPIYMLGFGLFLLFVKTRRSYGAGAILLSLFYGIFIIKIYLPITGGGHILGSSSQNFRHAGSNPLEIFQFFVTHPGVVLQQIFGSPEKLRTFVKLLQLTFFIPLFSPWCLLVLMAMALPLIRGDVDFIDLRFHYSAAIIPFLFIALVMGLKNLNRLIEKWNYRELFWRVLIYAMILVTGGNYLSHSLKSLQLETIRKAAEIPQGTIVVTQGHLLPYIGYRTLNFYFAPPFENSKNKYHERYDNADYYFLARSVNGFPYDRPWIEKKIEKLKGDSRLEVIYDDGERILLKRKEGIRG